MSRAVFEAFVLVHPDGKAATADTAQGTIVPLHVHEHEAAKIAQRTGTKVSRVRIEQVNEEPHARREPTLASSER